MSIIPEYIIDLDKPKSERWVDVIKENKNTCYKAFQEMEQIIDRTLGYMSKPILMLIRGYSSFGQAIHYEEIKSISDILHIDIEKVILLQLCYEMFAACTSAMFKFKGRNIHFRTMDWPMTFLKYVTVRLEFQRKGRTVFKAVSWLGYVGIFTGVAPEKYSVALNYRRNDDSIFNNVARAMTLKWPAGYMLRHILENEYNFKDAMNMIQEAQLIAPCYITICPDIGSSYLIIRDRDKTYQKRKSSKLLVQTNIDPDKVKPNILYSIERNEYARNTIRKKVNKWTNFEDIKKDLLKHPIKNNDTIYYCIIDPGTGEVMSGLC